MIKLFDWYWYYLIKFIILTTQFITEIKPTVNLTLTIYVPFRLHLPSCSAASRSPKFSSLTSSSLTLSMSTTVVCTLASAPRFTAVSFFSGFSSFRTDVASASRPVFDCLCRWVLGGTKAPLSLLAIVLDRGRWAGWAFEDFSILAGDSPAKSIGAMTVGGFAQWAGDCISFEVKAGSKNVLWLLYDCCELFSPGWRSATGVRQNK